MRRFPVRFALALTAAVGLTQVASAQGYGVYEQGACVMARAGTGVASPCADGSSIYFNPAGLTQSADVISVGGTLIAPRGSFTNFTTGNQSDLSDKVYPVPNVFIVKRFHQRYAAGIGLFAPYGLTTDWDPATAEGRFLGYKSVVHGLYLQPTVAAKVTDWLSAGAGFDLSFVHVQLRQHLDLSAQTAAPGVTFANLGVPTGTDFADLNLHANSTGTGYHVGIELTPVKHLTFGARYMSRQRVEFDDGTAEFTQINTGLVVPATIGSIPAGTPLDQLVAPQFASGGPLSTQNGATVLRLPEQVVFGVALQATPTLKLLGDVQWTNWNVFSELPIAFERIGLRTLREAYNDAWGFRFGGEYALSDASTVRAGWYTHGAAAPPETVTPNLPEGGRTSFTAGFGTRIARQMRVDVAYQYIDQADRQGRSTDGGLAAPTAAVNNGIYQFHAHLFGATFSYAF